MSGKECCCHCWPRVIRGRDDEQKKYEKEKENGHPKKNSAINRHVVVVAII